MINLLTGKPDTNEDPEPGSYSVVENDWTAEAHLRAIRCLLNDAGKPGADTENLLRAAELHKDTAALLVKIAEIGGPWFLSAKTAPAPRDDDAVDYDKVFALPGRCEYGDRVSRINGRDKRAHTDHSHDTGTGTVIDLARAADPEQDTILVLWDDTTRSKHRREELQILSRYNAATTPKAAAHELAAAFAKRTQTLPRDGDTL